MLTTFLVKTLTVCADALAIPMAFLREIRPAWIARGENFGSGWLVNLVFSVPLIFLIVYVLAHRVRFVCYDWGIFVALAIAFSVSFGVTSLQRRTMKSKMRRSPLVLLSLLMWIGIFAGSYLPGTHMREVFPQC